MESAKTSATVDRRSVVNPRQARALLAAVRTQKPSGPRLVAFFGVMYYAGLRPEEAVSLRKDNLTLPPRTWNKETRQWEESPESDGWGELEFRDASPDAGREWTDDGDHRERRQLKHRANGDSRTIPAHPELVALLHAHLEEIGTAPDGRLFTGVHGRELATITYRRALISARKAALTAGGTGITARRRPYDLRHACLSTWLNGGVQPPRWPSGQATASMCCSGSTPSASSASTRSPSGRISEALHEQPTPRRSLRLPPDSGTLPTHRRELSGRRVAPWTFSPARDVLLTDLANRAPSLISRPPLDAAHESVREPWVIGRASRHCGSL